MLKGSELGSGSGWRGSMLKGSGLEDCGGCCIKTGCERQRSHLEGGLRGNKSTAEGT